MPALVALGLLTIACTQAPAVSASGSHVSVKAQAFSHRAALVPPVPLLPPPPGWPEESSLPHAPSIAEKNSIRSRLLKSMGHAFKTAVPARARRGRSAGTC